METFHDRMKILIEMFGKGRKHTFGKKVLIPKATMQRYVDERIPSAEHLIAIHETFGVNLNWLFTGKGKMLVTEEIPQQKEVEVDYTKYFDQQNNQNALGARGEAIGSGVVWWQGF